MKIAIVRKECSFRKGGAERYAANLCTQLAKDGHEIFLLAAQCDAELLASVTHIPIKVDRLTSSRKNWSFHANSQKALAGLRVDRVFALSRSYPADAFRVSDPLHDFWMKVRYPGSFQGFLQALNPRHRTILRLEKGIFDPANTGIVVTNSKLSRTMIRDYHDYPEDRIRVIYNGVDLSTFRPPAPARPDRETLELLFVGQDFRRKGLAPLVHALASLKRSALPCRLRVIGRDDPAPYRKLAAGLDLAGLIRFEGPTRGIETAYQAADLLVFPTLYDPFANVCLEALACGLPVLTTATNGASEILDEGMDGYTIDGAEATLAEAIAAKIAAFHRLSPEERRAMHANARAKAERFTIQNNARGVVDSLAAARR